MSGLSDFLTQDTAPWWTVLASGFGGLFLSNGFTARADKKRRQLELEDRELERQDRWGKDILEYASAYIDAMNQIFNPDFVLVDDDLETKRHVAHDPVQLQQHAISVGQRLHFVAPTLRPQVQKVFSTTMAFYELDINQENRESEQRAAVATARAEFDAALNGLLGVRRMPTETTS